MTTKQPRRVKGTPAGGQFSETSHDEPDGQLDVPLPEPLPDSSLQPSARSAMFFLDNWRDREVDGTGDRFVLDAPYQRGSVWDDDQRRALIKSMLMGIPFGSVMISRLPFKTGRGSYRVVDGKQRIETMRGFVHDRFTVPGHWFEGRALTDPAKREGQVTHSDLSEYGQRMFSDRSVATIEFDPQTEHIPDGTGKYRRRTRSEDEIVAVEAELYNLINFGGVPQTEEDFERASKVADDHRK